jgi:hypothetical protein
MAVLFPAEAPQPVRGQWPVWGNFGRSADQDRTAKFDQKTRLLNTPIVARAGTASTSSCIDMLGGESPACTRNTPPGFWAKPAWLADIATSDDEEAIPCQAGGISRRRQKYAWTVPRAILPRRFPRHKISRWAHDGS